MIGENIKNSGYVRLGNRLLTSFNHVRTSFKNSKVMVLLNDNRGFLASIPIAMFIVLIFSATAILTGLGFGAKSKSTAAFMWFGSTMDFAAQASNMSGGLNQPELNKNKAKAHFKYEFSQVTQTTVSNNVFNPQPGSPFPGPIILQEFKSVNTGDPVPGGEARQPGYIAKIEVPVLSANVPFVGNQYISTPMEYFAVVKSTK
ncbi:MAG: hypothetical protein FH756_00300 [Firmicutes bacterium]|nr:hypothetical protein [Bacillota bacterium]